MDFIIENWYMIVIALCAIAAIIFAIVKFCKKSSNDKYEQIRGWLLQAVILAEQEYGAGTGRMKLSVVYDSFCTALPWIAKVISFEQFSEYVDEALDEAKRILSSNNSMAALAETMVRKDNNSDEKVLNNETVDVVYDDENFYIQDAE